MPVPPYRVIVQLQRRSGIMQLEHFWLMLIMVIYWVRAYILYRKTKKLYQLVD